MSAMSEEDLMYNPGSIFNKNPESMATKHWRHRAERAEAALREIANLYGSIKTCDCTACQLARIADKTLEGRKDEP